MQGGINGNQIHSPGLNDLPNNKNINQLSNEELIKLRKKGLRILADHSMFGINQRAKLGLPKPFLYVLFREPIERIISHYNFFYYRLGYSGCKGIPIEELPNKKLEFILQDLSELQVRYLTGVEKNTGSNVTERTFQQAIYNLENFYACFGILERIEDSMKVLKEIAPSWIGLSQKFPVVNKNNSKKGNQFPARIIEKLKGYNYLDFKLYDYVNKLFNLNYRNLVDEPKLKL